jgi:hypothetical protein
MQIIPRASPSVPTAVLEVSQEEEAWDGLAQVLLPLGQCAHACHRCGQELAWHQSDSGAELFKFDFDSTLYIHTMRSLYCIKCHSNGIIYAQIWTFVKKK